MISCQPKVRIISELAKVPEYQSQGAAAMDIHAAIEETKILAPGETFKVNTGLQIYIGNPQICAQIIPRSGLGARDRIVLANSTALIDSDYQGEWLVSVLNRTKENLVIKPGQEIAQFIFVPVIHPQFEEVNEFNDNSLRGEGGFGSTAKEEDDQAAA